CGGQERQRQLLAELVDRGGSGPGLPALPEVQQQDRLGACAGCRHALGCISSTGELECVSTLQEWGLLLSTPLRRGLMSSCHLARSRATLVVGTSLTATASVP